MVNNYQHNKTQAGFNKLMSQGENAMILKEGQFLIFLLFIITQ